MEVRDLPVPLVRREREALAVSPVVPVPLDPQEAVYVELVIK